MSDTRRSVTILGSTGSIGCNTVDLLQASPDVYRVEALVANANATLLAEQAKLLQAKLAVVADERQYETLKELLAGSGIEVAAGQNAVIEAAERPAEWVMSSIVGAAGLAPTLAAVRRGVTIGLANKETLVCAGDLVMAEVERSKATLLPVDSEHSAIFQVFDFEQKHMIDKIILTASGGPFREKTLDDMANVTREQALAHPNWSMGAKISIDSASMMNKGLEVIEAHHLFGMSDDHIDVVVHPQSVIHSLVAYADGSVLAQLGSPDMRTPIAFALGWPKRIHSPAPKLDLAQIANLTFQAPDMVRFPALRLARESLRAGGSAPTVLNAANEVAVQAFLDNRIRFLEIATLVEETLSSINHRPLTSLDDVAQMDAQARAYCTHLVAKRN